MSSPSRSIWRGKLPSSRPSRHTTLCGMERIGTRVHTVRWPVQKLALVGLPFRRSARSERTSSLPRVTALSSPSVVASSTSRSRREVSSARCQASPGGAIVSESAIAASSSAHSSHCAFARERVDGGVQPLDEFGQTTRQLDVAALDVVQWERLSEQPLAVLGHGHAEQDPVQAGTPGVGPDAAELEGLPVGGIEPPTHIRIADPLFEACQIVVGEPEPAPHRLTAGQVEDLADCHPRGRELEYLGEDTHHRIGLAKRTVSQADLQLARAVAATSLLFMCAESRLDERGEVLDVGAHHDDVARLEIRVLRQMVQDRIAQDLDLAAPAVAGVHADAVVVGRQWRECVGVADCPQASGRPGRRPGSAAARWAHRGAPLPPPRRRGSPPRRGRVASRGRRGPTTRAADCAAPTPSGPPGVADALSRDRPAARVGSTARATGGGGTDGRLACGQPRRGHRGSWRATASGRTTKVVAGGRGDCALAGACGRHSPGAPPGSVGLCVRGAAARARTARPPRRAAPSRQPNAAACQGGAPRSGRRGRPRAGQWRSASAPPASPARPGPR